MRRGGCCRRLAGAEQGPQACREQGGDLLVAELKPVPGSPGGEHQEYAQQADYLGVGVDLVAQLADCLAEGPGQQAAAISRVVITAMPCWAARDRNARRMRSWVSALPTGQAPAPAAGATTISVAATGRTASAAAPGPLGCREPGRSRTWPVRPAWWRRCAAPARPRPLLDLHHHRRDQRCQPLFARVTFGHIRLDFWPYTAWRLAAGWRYPARDCDGRESRLT